MKLLQRILVAVDFGPYTDQVITAARGIAKAFGSEIHLLHVLPRLDETVPETSEIMTMARQGAIDRLDQLRQGLASAKITVSDIQVSSGVPFDRINDYAEDHDVNVVVIGSSNRSASDSARLGVTAERVCRKSSKPVWVVAPDAQVPVRSIVCPVDGSSAAKRALRNAIHLARRFGARLSVVHVVRPYASFTTFLSGVDPAMEEHHFDVKSKKFDQLLRSFDMHGVTWEKIIRQGNPADTIIEIVKELSADLVIMGSVGDTGLSRILMGNVAGKVSRALPCSLVMMKAEDAIRLKLNEDLSDLRAHYAQGCELLENGFLEEAQRHFEHCLRTSGTFVPAWERIADVYERLGNTDRATEARKSAQQVEEALAWQRVEAEIRSGHPLWNRGSMG